MSERAEKLVAALAADLGTAWVCTACQQTNSGWTKRCGRCERVTDSQLGATGPANQECEWAAMREDRDQFEHRALAAEAELRETASALAEEKAEHKATLAHYSDRIERLEACLVDVRKAFLRDAAVAIKTARWPSGQVLSGEACWREARELWNAKPEDC